MIYYNIIGGDDFEKAIGALTAIPLLFAGCQSSDEAGDSAIFNVRVCVNCDDVYGIHWEYALDDDELGGGVTVNANNKAFKNGEEVVFDLDADYLEVTDRLQSERFRAIFTIVDENGGEIQTFAPEDWANSSENYDGTNYTLSENYDESGDVELYWAWSAEQGGEYEFTLTHDGGKYFLYPTH